jgi:hypothetical protein
MERNLHVLDDDRTEDDGAEALDVFDHPYACAAWRGLEAA